MVLLLLPWLNACTSLSEKKLLTETKPAMGPYETFSGRLIVMEPRRRWQVQLQWQAMQANQGWVRLTHVASNKVVELRWQDQSMQMRSNSALSWQETGQKQLAEQGIVLAPRQLATLLLGNTPAHFQRKHNTNADTIIWDSHGLKPFVRLQWQQKSHRLTMTDMTHGRQAILIIEP